MFFRKVPVFFVWKMEKGKKRKKHIIFAGDLENEMNLTDNVDNEQEEGILTPENDASGSLFFDPTGILSFADLSVNMVKKVSIQIRKQGLENFLANNKHKTFEYKTKSGFTTNIWTMEGAIFNDTEFHISEKLAKSGQHVLFPSHSDLGTGRKNDLFLYDAKTYIQQKVELKALFGTSLETLKSQIISGTGQASVIAYDIKSNIKKNRLIDGLRGGWGKDTKKILLNWKGQWYEIDKEHVFKKGWLEKILK